MFRKTLHFIQYNNLTIVLILAFFLIGAGAFAQTETGQELVGTKQTKIEGVDNTLLLELDLNKFDMNYKIERIEQDEKYYYVTYTYLDLVKLDNAWQYQVQEKTRKININLKDDLGVYIAKELREQYESRIKELNEAQKIAKNEGEVKRTEVVTYSGLIGQTLELTSKVFPGYSPVKKNELPAPNIPPTILSVKEGDSNAATADNLTDIYNEYIAANDPDNDNIFGSLDNCPQIANSDQKDSDNDGTGDVCDSTNNLPNDQPASTSTPSLTEEKNGAEKTINDDMINSDNPVAGEDGSIEPDVEIVEPNGEITNNETITQ